MPFYCERLKVTQFFLQNNCCVSYQFVYLLSIYLNNFNKSLLIKFLRVSVISSVYLCRLRLL